MTSAIAAAEPAGVSRMALLMIDFQRDFCAEGGYSDRFAGLEWVKPILAPARRLLDAARKSGLLVVHTREGYAADLSDCSPAKLLRSRKAGSEIGSVGPMGRLLIRGEHGHDIIDALKPVAGEIVIDKASYGAFCGTNCESILRSRGIDTLVFAGVTADVCVHTTLREAYDRWFDCFYVKDAISCFDPEIRRACEKMIEEEGGIWGALTTVEQMTQRWSASTHSPTVCR
ncbi:MAG TPA: isochorismatase family cysteine hydrolase [Polyangiaceae bacterium]|nr:isochorismatase family cysteine hydrolase [Polyangiaceae bacterium]